MHIGFKCFGVGVCPGVQLGSPGKGTDHIDVDTVFAPFGSGDPETEIGRACVALASPDLKYMSGETITLEGGLGLRP